METLLPELMLRLIQASPDLDASKINLPTGSGISKPGFDAIVFNSSTRNGNIKEGPSYWEFGSDKNAYKKILKDLRKRVETLDTEDDLTDIFTSIANDDKIKKLSEEDKEQIKNKMAQNSVDGTFYLVATGEDDAGEAAFNRYKCLVEGLWKGGIVTLLAEQLHAWISQYPAIHAWISYEFNGQSHAVRSSSEVLAAWESETSPPESSSIIERMLGWDSFKEDLLSKIELKEVIRVARTHKDALVWICKAIESTTSLPSRTVIVDSPSALLAFSRTQGKDLVIIPTFSNPYLSLRAESDNSIILLEDALQIPSSGKAARDIVHIANSEIKPVPFDTIQKEPTGRAELASPWNDGIDRGVFSHGSYEDLDLHRKRKMLIPEKQWEPSSLAEMSVAPLLLLGSWTESSLADRTSAEFLTGLEYSEIETILRLPSLKRVWSFDGDVWLLDPYIAEVTPIFQLVSNSHLEKWKSLLLSQGSPTSPAALSFNAQEGILKTLARWSMVAEDRLTFFSPALVEITQSVEDPDSEHSLWSMYPGRQKHKIIFEAFPFSILLLLQHCPDRTPFQASTALKYLAASPSHADLVLSFVLDRVINNPEDWESFNLLVELLDPLAQLLDMPSDLIERNLNYIKENHEEVYSNIVSSLTIDYVGQKEDDQDYAVRAWLPPWKRKVNLQKISDLLWRSWMEKDLSKDDILSLTSNCTPAEGFSDEAIRYCMPNISEFLFTIVRNLERLLEERSFEWTDDDYNKLKEVERIFLGPLQNYSDQGTRDSYSSALMKTKSRLVKGSKATGTIRIIKTLSNGKKVKSTWPHTLEQLPPPEAPLFNPYENDTSISEDALLKAPHTFTSLGYDPLDAFCESIDLIKKRDESKLKSKLPRDFIQDLILIVGQIKDNETAFLKGTGYLNDIVLDMKYLVEENQWIPLQETVSIISPDLSEDWVLILLNDSTLMTKHIEQQMDRLRDFIELNSENEEFWGEALKDTYKFSTWASSCLSHGEQVGGPVQRYLEEWVALVSCKKLLALDPAAGAAVASVFSNHKGVQPYFKKFISNPNLFFGSLNFQDANDYSEQNMIASLLQEKLDSVGPGHFAFKIILCKAIRSISTGLKGQAKSNGFYRILSAASKEQ